MCPLILIFCVLIHVCRLWQGNRNVRHPTLKIKLLPSTTDDTTADSKIKSTKTLVHILLQFRMQQPNELFFDILNVWLYVNPREKPRHHLKAGSGGTKSSTTKPNSLLSNVHTHTHTHTTAHPTTFASLPLPLSLLLQAIYIYMLPVVVIRD